MLHLDALLEHEYRVREVLMDVRLVVEHDRVRPTHPVPRVVVGRVVLDGDLEERRRVRELLRVLRIVQHSVPARVEHAREEVQPSRGGSR